MSNVFGFHEQSQLWSELYSRLQDGIIEGKSTFNDSNTIYLAYKYEASTLTEFISQMESNGEWAL